MRWIRRLRVVPCLAEMTQQIHSFRASGVRSFQAACVVASESRASRMSSGVLCTYPSLLSFFIIILMRQNWLGFRSPIRLLALQQTFGSVILEPFFIAHIFT